MTAPTIYRIHVLDVHKKLVTHSGEMTLHLVEYIPLSDTKRLVAFVRPEHLSPQIDSSAITTAASDDRILFGMVDGESVSWEDTGDLMYKSRNL